MGLYLNESGVLTPIAGRGDLTAIRSEMSYLGAKNLLPFNLGHIKKVNGGGTWNGNVYTYRDITYTVNADGTITVDGTASADSIFRVLDTASLAFALNPDKTYYYTGSPATGSSASTYYSYYSELIGGTWTYFMNYGASDTSITPNASATQIVVDIFVKSGKTIDNQVFKPMIRLASDPDNTYVPYAKTNQELTENIGDLFENGIDRIAMYDWGNTPPWMSSALSANTLDDIIAAMPTIERPSRLIIGTGVNNTNVLAVDLKTKGLHDSGATIGYLEITKITSYQNRVIVEYTYKDGSVLKKRIASVQNGTWTTAQTIL